MIRYVALALLTLSHAFADNNLIRVGTEGASPPFNYIEHGKLIGYEIDLTKEIAKRLGKQVKLYDMQFTALLPSLNSKKIDVAVSTVTITKEREKNFDFSIPYTYETMAVIYRKNENLNTIQTLNGKSICVQLGTTMEIWSKENLPKANIIAMDKENMCVEAVKAKQLDAYVLDGTQAILYADNNPTLASTTLVVSKDGYGYVFKKGSTLKEEFNIEIENIINDGTMKKLREKWKLEN